jgi:hypothetical protein
VLYLLNAKQGLRVNNDSHKFTRSSCNIFDAFFGSFLRIGIECCENNFVKHSIAQSAGVIFTLNYEAILCSVTRFISSSLKTGLSFISQNIYALRKKFFHTEKKHSFRPNRF